MKEALRQGFTDLRSGFRLVISIPWIWISVLIFGFINIMEASPRAVAMPFLIKDDLGADVGLLGILGSAASIGFVVGMSWLGQYVRLHRRGLLGYLSVFVTGACLLPFALKLPIPILVLSMFITGLASSVFALIWTHTFLLAAVIITAGEMIMFPTNKALAANFSPVDMRGRYMAVYDLGWTIPATLGPAAAGLILDNFNPDLLWFLGGLLCAVSAISFYGLHLWLGMQERFIPEPVEVEHEAATSM